MRYGILAILLAILTVPCAVAQGMAQDVEPGTLEEIEAAYRQFEYERAEALARQALQNYGNFMVGELAEIHTMLGLIAYNRGQQEEARRQFLSALQLVPGMEMDPALVPPKIVSYFENLRAEVETGAAFASEGSLRYVLVQDPRVEAALRSMMVPGWGQLYKGQDRRAGVFAGLFGVAAGGALYTHFRMRSARNRYEDAGTAAEAERYYGPYNRLYRARNGLLQGAVVVWLASYVDALLTRSPLIEDSGFGVQASGDGLSLSLTF